MRRWFLLLLVAVLIPVGHRDPGHAQDQAPPLVVFVEDQQLLAASIADSGPDGLTRLEQVFKVLGARTSQQDLTSPLPKEARVVVLVGPVGPLSPAQLARLWVYMVNGGHLLLAIDPIGLTVARDAGYLPVGADRARSGLATLLKTSYGIGLQDTFVVDPWFSLISIIHQNTTLVSVYAEGVVQHAVDEPLLTYNLPVEMWGARTMTVDPLGPDSHAIPLLYTESGYGETDQGVFNTLGTPSPLELNLGADVVGRLFTAALAENTRFGSRVVVLGSSASVENGYGLAVDADGLTPLYLANRIFAERVAAWLLDLPEESWPPLPDSYTWLALDGKSSDWGAISALLTDVPNDARAPQYDIRAVSGFRDDSFLYLLITTAEMPDPEARLTLAILNSFDGVVDYVNLSITAKQVVVQKNANPEEAVPDARMVAGQTLEVWLPLRVIGENPRIRQACLSDSRTSADSAPTDCVTQQPPAAVSLIRTQAPNNIRFPDGPRAVVLTAAGINVRSGPGTDWPVLRVVPYGTTYAATGRTANGDWIRVENALYTGWLANLLVALNSPRSNLPVVESPTP
ncbi:MAG TPA: SH3 domain-containing protein [Aggregatilineaceae bacterium]|nr:SH3 domain-containing protein [Aggregatilineaceae bacterium]